MVDQIQIHELISALYRPPNTLFGSFFNHFFDSSFLFLVPSRIYSTETSANRVFLYDERFVQRNNKCTPKTVGVHLKKRVFSKRIKNAPESRPRGLNSCWTKSDIKKLLWHQLEGLNVDFLENFKNALWPSNGVQ